MKTSAAGIALIKRNEGCELEAYQDVVGVWTIGYGDTLNVRPGMRITRQEAEEGMARRLANEFEPGVMGALHGAHVTQAQFDAMVSLAWNIGVGAFKRSSVVRCHCAGDFQAAADAFRLYNKAKGQVLNGLVRRREEERAMYLSDVQPDVGEPKPPREPSVKLDKAVASFVRATKRLQKELTAAGYEAGKADGDYGAKTRAALRQYRQENAA